MKLEDAPPAGWYPDPEGGQRLRWWEGTDWTDMRRPRPSAAETAKFEQKRSEMQAPSAPASSRTDGSRMQPPTDTDRVVSQVREAAREEMTRAADELSRRAQRTVDLYQSVAAQYASRIWRWVRFAIVVAAVLVVAWFVLQFIAQATLLEWIGDRIDNIIRSE